VSKLSPVLLVRTIVDVGEKHYTVSSSIPMTNLPDELRPSDSLQVELPSGETIQLPCCRPHFERWAGAPIKFYFGRKPLLAYQQQPIFAELLILRLLEAHGWEGVWVSSYGGIKYLRQMPQDSSLAHGRVSLPDDREHLLNRIWEQSGRRSGCFDIYAWRADAVLFCEAKRRGKDRIRLSQCSWIEAAILEGVAPDSLLIVEWAIRAL
jgi:hypothetical protein